MNELELTRKNEILKSMMTTELAPLDVQNEISLRTYSKVPLSRITALGTGFEPIATAVQQVTSNGQAVSGYYKVTIPAGTHLASFKDGTGFLGTALSDSANTLNSQARLNPLVCNPTMLLVAATLANIDKKLDDIQEIQQNMLDFLVQKQKSELKGDLDFLMDIYNNYKYNWNSERYKTANHNKVLDIRQNAGHQIDFYREQIKRRLSKKTLLHSDQDVKKQLAHIQEEFREYQLALYIYGFAYFLEIILQENYDSNYLNSISKKIDDMAFQYRELYTLTYSQIENLSKSSLQSKFFSGLSAVNKVTGEAIAKVPVISKSQIDETLIAAGTKIGSYEEKRIQTTMKQLLNSQNSFVRPFVENINTVNRLYNEPMTLIFDKETLYLG